MENLGLGVMIRLLSHGRSEKAENYYSKKIVAAELNQEQPTYNSISDNAVLSQLFLTFDSGEKISIYDGGQCCCEHRYMSTDDDVQSLVGNTLTSIEIKSGAGLEYGEDGEETQFLEIRTDQNFVTIVNHNEHNGYYGGFALCIEAIVNEPH